MGVHHYSGKDAVAVVAAVAALALAASGPAYAGEPPNDPGFSQQWGDENTGQAIPTQQVPGETLGPFANGTVGADESALAAWQMATGSPSIVIGEVDTGIEYTHPDLAQNIWTNPGGVGGCAAGTHGFNMLVVEALPESERNC